MVFCGLTYKSISLHLVLISVLHLVGSYAYAHLLTRLKIVIKFMIVTSSKDIQPGSYTKIFNLQNQKPFPSLFTM